MDPLLFFLHEIIQCRWMNDEVQVIILLR